MVFMLKSCFFDHISNFQCIHKPLDFADAATRVDTFPFDIESDTSEPSRSFKDG